MVGRAFFGLREDPHRGPLPEYRARGKREYRAREKMPGVREA
jgi:hypothetical protein